MFEAAISYAGGIGTITSTGTTNGQQSNGLFLLVPAGVTVDEITFTGNRGAGTDEHVLGVALSSPIAVPMLSWVGAASVALLMLGSRFLPRRA